MEWVARMKGPHMSCRVHPGAALPLTISITTISITMGKRPGTAALTAGNEQAQSGDSGT